MYLLLCAEGMGTSLVAQWSRTHLPMRDIWVPSLGWEDPLEGQMETHSSVLAWKTEEPGGLQSTGSQRVEDTSQQLNRQHNLLLINRKKKKTVAAHAHAYIFPQILNLGSLKLQCPSIQGFYLRCRSTDSSETLKSVSLTSSPGDSVAEKYSFEQYQLNSHMLDRLSQPVCLVHFTCSVNIYCIESICPQP